MAFIIAGTAIGALCALFRRHAFMVVALSALLASVVALGGFALHSSLWAVVAQVCGSVIALQFVYVTLSLTVHLVRFGKLIPQVQKAIGDRLRAEIEVPHSLTPELSVLVARLRSA
jgi:hypothetical protein